MSESTQTPFPLSWPTGWKRSTFRQKSPFYSGARNAPLTVAEAIDRLERELFRLGVKSPILSSNVVLTLSGTPRSGTPEPPDPGIAVYFQFRGKPMVLACDKWNRVACNIAAVAKHVEALRGQERWGVGTLDQAFAGYSMLPAPEDFHWWKTLGFETPVPLVWAESRYRALAKEFHPDMMNGNADRMAELNRAIREARARIEA